MTSARIPTVEIESLVDFDARLPKTTTLRGWAVQSVDLRGRAAALESVDVRSALFLGCTMPAAMEDDLTNRGALVFPPLPDVPFNPYRAGLYTAAELYDGLGRGYAATTDGRVYAWYTAQARGGRGNPPLPSTLAMSLHDQAIGDALYDLLSAADERRLVGVMGGHAATRGDDDYRLAARLGAELARLGFGVATGGGPGAMEACNLGARLANADAADEAVGRLAAVPGFGPDVAAWARVALEVAPDKPGGGLNIGIPTWFYGHEPPNAFAGHIAKFFSNALREDVLLTRCQGGVIVLPGAAGTVQEIFQCATRSYYAAPSLVTPLVLVGRQYWTQHLPAWPLLQALGDGRTMGHSLHMVDDVDEALEALAGSGLRPE